MTGEETESLRGVMSTVDEPEERPVSQGLLATTIGIVLDGPLIGHLEQEQIDALAAEVAERLLADFNVTRTVRRG